MKWDVKQPRTYFKSILDSESQLSSSERTMQIKSHTNDSKNVRKTNEKQEADIGIEYIQFPHVINNIAQIEILL